MACIAKRRGRYVIDFYDTNGKRRWITLPARTTKKKAKEKLRNIEDQVARGVFIPDKKIPTFKEVAEDWLKYKKPNIRFNTWQRYDGYVRNHYQMFLKVPVNRITTAQIEKFISAKQASKTNIITLKKMLVALNQVFKYAVRHHYIDHNPVSSAERPQDQRSTKQKEVIQILTPDQIAAFLDNVETYEFQVLFQLAIFSGARQSELFGLKWNCVDWKNSQIEIKRSYNGGRWYPPKSKASRRKIDIGPAMLAELKRWRLKSIYSSDENLVFPNNIGNPLDPNELVRHHFYPTLASAELPKIRFHDLRHTYASLKIEQGENIVYISNQMGHSKVSTTLDIYGHMIKTDNHQSACGLEEMVFQNFGSKMVAEPDFEVKKKVNHHINN
jgi:integrase